MHDNKKKVILIYKLTLDNQPPPLPTPLLTHKPKGLWVRGWSTGLGIAKQSRPHVLKGPSPRIFDSRDSQAPSTPYPDPLHSLPRPTPLLTHKPKGLWVRGWSTGLGIAKQSRRSKIKDFTSPGGPMY
jgi:hypothetical protein